jgi:type VI secretion system protein ImpL
MGNMLVTTLPPFSLALALSTLFWTFGPLVLGEAFESPAMRIALSIVPLLFAGIVLGVLGWRKRKREAALVEAATAEDPATAAKRAAEGRIAEDEAKLKEKLTAALNKLKDAKAGKLYDLPWYVIIGPPGTGKTTALENSGLEFPLTDGGRLQGVGGTRDCDWWLTDQAVLLDTAGRYTTQDSDAVADKGAWERFLGLLKKSRPKMPLNGIIVAFSVDMIARLDPAARDGHARTVRSRIKELEKGLGQRLPIYLMITKSDLMPGFMEFFDDLDKAGREQVWGVTFPAAMPAEGAPALFPAEMKALLARLEERLLERLQTERGPQQRALLAGLPAQYAALEPALQAFLTAAFGGSRLDPAPFLRGVYFTSGTQEGSPLDRLAGAMSRSFGLDPRRPAAVMGQKGRAYFITRLLKDVIFREARLASGDQAAAKRRMIVQAAAWSVALLAVLGGGLWGWNASNAEAERAARIEAQLRTAEAAHGPLRFERVEDPDLAPVIGYLEAARPLPEAARGEVGLGLSQEDRLVQESQLAYRRVLSRVLLPRLIARLEGQIRSGLQRPDFLYEATRVYLMLGRQGPLDRSLVSEWFRLDWEQLYPGAVNQPGRDALMQHLTALLATDFPAYPVDGALVDAARRVISRVPLAERVLVRWRAMAGDARPWRPSDALGAAGQRYFARASGRPLTEGVPGAFTVEGLHRVLLPGLPRAVLEASSEAWVLGPEVGAGGDPRRLEADVLALYARDYIRQWDALLNDLVLPPFGSLNEAAEALNLLGAPNSPMRDVIRAIARQVSVGTPPDAPAAPDAAAAAAQSAAGGAAARLAAAVGARASSVEPVARVVEEHYRPLREAAGDPMETILRAVSDLYVQVARLANAPPGTVLPPSQGLDPGQRLLAEAARQPVPLGPWLSSLGQSTQRARAGGARAAISAAGQQQLAPLCRGLETRFPFRRTANAPDMPIDDFVRLFSPGGVLDRFFAEQIRPYADVTQNPWRPVAADGLEPPVNQDDLIQFQRAAVIRTAFFPSGSPGIGLGLRWTLAPRGLPVGATGATMEVEGQRIQIPPDGGNRPVEIVWPARSPVSLAVEPGGSPLAYDGPWAGLKLAFLNRLAQTRQPDQFTLQAGPLQFLLQAASSINPFGIAELRDFRCPALPPP